MGEDLYLQVTKGIHSATEATLILEQQMWNARQDIQEFCPATEGLLVDMDPEA